MGLALQAGLSRLDAQLLLAESLGRSRSWLIAHDDEQIDSVLADDWGDRVQRRASGEPMAYLLRRKEFFGLLLDVDRDVLVPRPDTETLVGWALEVVPQLPTQSGRPQLIDLGCGSGAIALALKHFRGDLEVTATDCSAAALAVAAGNAKRLGLPINWRAGDWWAAVAGRRFDLAVANPPYIAADDPHLSALRHEPQQALVAAENGLAALRRIVEGAGSHLTPDAWLLLEHGFQQAPDVVGLLEQAGFTDVQTRRDLGGQPRCTGARWPKAAV